MTTSAQDRLKILLPNRPKLANPNIDDLHFSEKELLDYRQRQQKAAHPLPDQIDQDPGSSADEDDFVRAQAPVKPRTKPNNNPSRGSKNAQAQQRYVPGTVPDQVVSLPEGDWEGGLPAAQVDDDGDHRRREPGSSNHECIGHFCIWSLVAKFPYKYMRDPDNKVSRRFFASEKIYERNWQV